MECRDAQFYLRLRRHAADELGAEVTGALEGHLAVCPACAADARAAFSFDRAVATAMTAVPVPTSLRERLITRAAAKQGALLRRKLYRIGTACAAALVLLALGFGVFSSVRPTLDTDKLVLQADEQVSAPEESVRSWLAQQKLPNVLPAPFDQFDYTQLAGFGTAEVQGKSVPVITFRNDTGFAKVYLFRDTGPFDLKEVRDAQSSRASALIVRGQGLSRGTTYVCVYTGHDLKPFLRTRNGGQAAI
jgi:hypothetical protein